MDDLEIQVSFGEWLKSRRKVLDLTQEELALRSGCSIFALRKIESGERRPSKQLAGLLAAALEICEEDRPTFIRVARGEMSLERIRSLLLITKPASLTPHPATHHLPFTPTPLLGRESELMAMERIFDESSCRLLTLTGMGGIGKTRLAIEFASRRCGKFPGGVHYIPLASINAAELIIPSIAEALEFSFSGPADPKEQLFNHLAREVKQPALLIFDNFEHLLAQSSTAVDLVAEILQRFASIKILCTSRERLNLHGEWVYELHGLPTPPSDYIDSLEDYSAAVLFIQCARRMDVEFELTEADQPALIRICQLVEGIPLAIELATAWVGMLSCREIAQEIESSIDFLTTSMRDIPERHRSLRATFDHSWRLLSDAERDALNRLSVFHGGFDRIAAEQVAGASLLLMSSLVSKSLVRRTQNGRYDLHEVIRQYVLVHQNEDPSRFIETCDRHSEYYLHLLSGYEKKLKSASQQEGLRQLTNEIDNIHAAWAWAINQEKFTLLGQAGRAFGWYFELAGLYREGIEQFELLSRILKARWHEKEWHTVLGLTYIQQALLYFRKGDNDKARKLYEESIPVLRPTGDQALLTEALIFLGIILHLFGEYTRAKLLLEEGLALARENNERWFEAYAIYNLGYIASLLGHYTEGYEQMMAGIVIWRSLGDPHYIALGLNFIVPTLIKLGKFDEGRAFMLESIALCEQVKNRWGMGTAYRYLGSVCTAEGFYAEAQAHLLKSLEVFGEHFPGWHIAISTTFLGHATRMAGNYPEARRYYLDALGISVEDKAIPIMLDVLSGLSYLQAKTGSAENALMLCYLIINHPSSEDETRCRADQLRVALESGLSPEQIKTASANAQEKTLDLVVNEILETAGG